MNLLEYIPSRVYNDMGIEKNALLKHYTKSLNIKKIEESDYTKTENISSLKYSTKIMKM